jgi:hypothetical protein
MFGVESKNWKVLELSLSRVLSCLITIHTVHLIVDYRFDKVRLQGSLLNRAVWGRGIHGPSKAGPGAPDPSTPCGRATPETALRPFLGSPARRAGGLRLFPTPPPNTPRRTSLLLKLVSFESIFVWPLHVYDRLVTSMDHVN